MPWSLELDEKNVLRRTIESECIRQRSCQISSSTHISKTGSWAAAMLASYDVVNIPYGSLADTSVAIVEKEANK